ncbi:hypothetical protein LC065_03870 [Halobacillus litoralis]|uniref:Uncharacterized protein n=2 Tax=Halobacillus TaxID=45667 RepID=A0A3E0J2P9_9BACI|nr:MULTISPECIES: hypothetical protein [Halobacillus]RDY68013.1 hypothetical protein DXT76_18295 [Halobacillus trueperi]REJ07109.1 hypothetical protein DYE48_17395 [Halobacillus trueperi]WLR48379.1 hypothetical protein LC065_03870 [Halobacillus litoralis]SDP60289.1 hypothetical protein SAMN05421677_1242 [Halobacillus aidingensis]
MHGLMINEQERREIEYLLKREMEEITFDLGDHRIDQGLKRAMEERYEVLFQIFRRFATREECLQYMPRKKKQN